MRDFYEKKFVDFRDPGQRADVPMIRSWHDQIVFTNGCFDLLHPGHLESLMFCDDLRKSGTSALVVAINSDQCIKRLKGPERPIVDERSRALILTALEFVDYVILFDEDTPRELLELLRPDIVVKGGDYHGKQIVGSEQAVVHLAPYVDGWSTTHLIEKIRSGSGL